MTTRKRNRSSPSSRTIIGAFLRRPAVQIMALIVAVIILYIVIFDGKLNGQKNEIGSGGLTGLPREIGAEQAYQKYQAGVVVLDVRTQEEWDEYHVPNTTLIPLDQLPARMGELPRNREIIVICRSGNRSQQGRDILLSGGFTQVTSMTGGLKEWSALGYPLEGTRP